MLYLTIKISHTLTPKISISRDTQLRLKSLTFLNTMSNVKFSLPEKKFSSSNSVILETKIMYFPLVLSSLHSRSSNMLLDEYFEIDLHLHSLVETANHLYPSTEIKGTQPRCS